jgi:hypothetical protein
MPRGALVLAALASLLLVAWPLTSGASLVEKAPPVFRALCVVLLAGYLSVLGSAFLRSPVPCGRLATVSAALGLALMAGLAAVLSWKVGPRSSLVYSLVLLATPLGASVAGFLVAQTCLARGGRLLGWQRGSPPGPGTILVLAALATAAALGTGQNLVRREGQPSRPSLPPATPEQIANGSLNLALPCLARYAVEHGQYPSRFADIEAGGTGCLPEKYGEGQIPGYRILYEARPPGTATSPWGSFSLRYEPLEAGARSGRVLETDETGLVYEGAGSDRRPRISLIDAPGELGFLQACVERFRLKSGTGRYPDHLDEAAPDVSSCFQSLRMAPDPADPGFAGRLRGYRFSYTPRREAATGRVLDYRLDARPVVYGHPYKRSYACDTRGGMRATEQDRPVEDTDPSTGWDAVLQEERGTPCHTPAWWEASLSRTPSPGPYR